MFEISYRPRIVYGFIEGRGGVTEWGNGEEWGVIEWGRNVDDLVVVCPPPNLGREEFC